MLGKKETYPNKMGFVFFGKQKQLLIVFNKFHYSQMWLSVETEKKQAGPD